MATEFEPYVGPRPYERDDEVPLYGRDQEADQLLSHIVSFREVLFYAQSGTGKTSLLNAKVIPMLEELGFEVLPLARVQGVIPSNVHPEEIRNIYVFNTLLGWAGDSVDSQQFVQMSLTEFLKGRPRPIDEDGRPSSPRAIIFDQFEELFALYHDRWRDRRKFFEQVCDALKDDDHFLRVVFTMREDYVAQLDPFASLLSEKLRIRFRLEHLRREAALLAVTGPLKATRLSFAPGVAEKLVEDLLKTRAETVTGETVEVVGEFVEPVQLQVVCQNLWQEMPQDVTQITEQHLLVFGDLDRPLSKFYESAISAAAAQTNIYENALRRWCQNWLITSTGTRGIVHRDPQQTKGIPNEALDILATRHLIRSEWRAGAHWYELTHDRFIAPIRSSNERWNKLREEKLNQASLLLRQAEQGITMQQFERSLDTAKQALMISEENEEPSGMALALLYVGKASEGMKQYDAALQTYYDALQIADQIGEQQMVTHLLETMASLFEQVKQYDQAIKCYSYYIELLPDDPNGYNGRGNAHFALKNYEEALTDYNLALEVDPKFAGAYHNRGIAYANLKKHEQALADYNRALELDPFSVDTYINRGIAYADHQEYEQALADYNRALELDPSNTDTYLNRGYTYLRLKKIERALADFNRVLKLDPASGDAYNGRGDAYTDLQDYERALADYNQALELDPNNADMYLNRGYTYLRLNDTEQAGSNFVKSTEVDPKNVNAAWMVIYATMNQRRPGIEIVKRLEVIATIDLSQAESHICKGVALAIKGEFEEGLVELEQAILPNPQTQDTHFWKGMIYAYMGQNQEAIRSVQKALEQGLPPILLRPLYWLEKDNPYFYQNFVVPLLSRFNI